MKRSILLLVLGLLIPACKGHGGGGPHPVGVAVLSTIGSRLFEASRHGGFPAPLSGPVLGDNLQLQGLEFDPLTGELLSLDAGRGRLIRIHPTTYAVTDVGLTGFHTLGGLALDPGARKLYASSLYRHLVQVDLATGLATDIGPTGGATLQGLAYNAAGGILYGVEDPSPNLYTVNPLTGATTFLMNVNGSSGLAFDSNTGLLYVLDNGTHQLVKVNPVAMTSTFLGGGANLPSISGLAYVPGTNKLFGIGVQSLYDIDLTTGAITLLAQLGVNGPTDIAYDPLLNVFYGISQALLCKITPQGVMTPIGPTGAFIAGVAFEPVTRTLYGSDPLTTGNLHTLNLSTGAATPVGALGVGNIIDLAWDPTTSTLYGLYPGELYTINTTTGAATFVGGTGGLKDSFVVEPGTGTMYATSTFPEALFTINKASGAATQIAPMGLGAATLEFSTAENTLFGSGLSLMKINKTTGAATPVDGLGFQITHVAWDPDSRTLFGINGFSPRLFTIEASTGKATFVTLINTTILRTFTVDRDTHTLWGTDLNNRLVKIHPVTGAVTDVGPTGMFPSGLAYHPGLHQMFAVDLAGSDRLFSLNTTTGASMLVGPIGFTDLTSLTYDPTTGTLLGYDAATDQLLDVSPATGAGTAASRGKGAISSLAVRY